MRQVDGPDRVTASWHDDDDSKREVGPHRNVPTPCAGCPERDSNPHALASKGF